jgi:predicted metalloprotease with PDZ domain
LPRADKTVDETANDDESANSIWKCFSRRANSFDELVDSPMLMGDLAIQTFHVSGICHYLACYGTDETWDLDQATRDCAKIVAVQHAFWGEIPYPSYWFINMALESYGGLEHDNNTVLFTSRWAMRKRTTYLEWLGLVSHEFFHAWNVRRLRPKNLICYDYGAEQYTPELWIAEGITSYFDDLFVLRAGLLAQDEYLGMLGKLIQQVDDAPGSLVQTLKDASFDTWIKHYRPDENSINSRVSYYTKGALVAFLLDIHLRMLSDDRSSLGDLMRELWKRYRVSGYTLSDFESVASELAGSDLSAWFERHVHRSEALDYRQALDWLGLEIVSTNIAAPQDSTRPQVATEKMTDGSESEWELGCETTYRDGRIIVTRIVRGSSASIAGLQVDDELIAFSGHRLPKENWKDRLQY